MGYRRITYTERLIIEKMFNLNNSYRSIANFLHRSVSSIYAEVQKGLYQHLDGATWLYVERYSASIAQEHAIYNHSAHGRSLAVGNNHEYTKVVSARILSGESPDAIVGSLRKDGQWTVSTPTLYRYIDKGYIPQVSNKNLLNKRLKRRYHHVYRANRPPAGMSIEHRPKEVASRTTFGHWEMDCVQGKAEGIGQSLLVLTERLTRYELIFKLSAKTAVKVNRIVESLLKQYPVGTFQSITVDNGSEFSSAKELPLPVYYCHPYCSSERGSNENANKIIRRFFPKGESLYSVTQADCDTVSTIINNMHRKVLGYFTAKELFHAHVNSLL